MQPFFLSFEAMVCISFPILYNTMPSVLDIPPPSNSLLLLSLPNDASLIPPRPFVSFPQTGSAYPNGNSRYSHRARALPQPEALESLSGVVTDKTVPEGHKGLHGFLYGDDADQVHTSTSRDFFGREGEDDGSTIMAFVEYVKAREKFKFAGVYAIHDKDGKLQYVGYSRNVPLSLKGHMDRVGSEKCSFVRVKLFSDPSLISRAKFEEEKQIWLKDGDIPPGNSDEKDLWENNTVGIPLKVMSEEERAEYEDKKLKMRKAMGENLYDDVEGEETDSRIRRLKLLQATEGDDWSSVIDGQTKETIDGKKDKTLDVVSPSGSNGGEGKQAEEQIVSPFIKPDAHRSKGLYSAESYELTLENVDEVLNDVRPYLIADGGNVEVVSLDEGIVSLRLQGACGTCASSTVTMKMGIEKVLKEKFGSAFKEVVQVDQQDIGASVMAVNAHLDILRPAIHNYGGSVEVVSVLEGECQVKYKGPPPIAMGIQAAIKDKFPDISSVVLLDI